MNEKRVRNCSNFDGKLGKSRNGIRSKTPAGTFAPLGSNAKVTGTPFEALRSDIRPRAPALVPGEARRRSSDVSRADSWLLPGFSGPGAGARPGLMALEARLRSGDYEPEFKSTSKSAETSIDRFQPQFAYAGIQSPEHVLDPWSRDKNSSTRDHVRRWTGRYRR
ncbi:MAG: hypothetical protein ACYCOU_01945 [Sulfobacillus sp.]